MRLYVYMGDEVNDQFPEVFTNWKAAKKSHQWDLDDDGEPGMIERIDDVPGFVKDLIKERGELQEALSRAVAGLRDVLAFAGDDLAEEARLSARIGIAKAHELIEVGVEAKELAGLDPSG